MGRPGLKFHQRKQPRSASIMLGIGDAKGQALKKSVEKGTNHPKSQMCSARKVCLQLEHGRASPSCSQAVAAQSLTPWYHVNIPKRLSLSYVQRNESLG